MTLRAPRSAALGLLGALALTLLGACGAGFENEGASCPPGRTRLDGVCVREAVADYVACVRAQGAQLGDSKSKKMSAEAGNIAAHASGTAEISEDLQKKYSASDAAMLEIIRICNTSATAAHAAGQGPAPIDVPAPPPKRMK